MLQMWGLELCSLSQRLDVDGQTSLCLFVPAEHNYDTRNRELLVVMVALGVEALAGGSRATLYGFWTANFRWTYHHSDQCGLVFKKVQFVPLQKLLTAKKKAEAILQNVARKHGFLVDMVSDWGPQFIYQFWKAFCSLVGASASLFWFYLQSNGQMERLNQELVPAQWSKIFSQICSQHCPFCVHRPLTLSLCLRL